MSKYRYLYLFWLLPAYMLFLTIHQIMVYYGIEETYLNGTSYSAEVVEFEIKQIASQTNGYVILEFVASDNKTINRKLSLPIELASMISELKVIPIRYNEKSFEEIVMIPVYREQKSMVLSNAVMSFIGLLFASFIALLAHRHARKKVKQGEEKLEIERVDV